MKAPAEPELAKVLEENIDIRSSCQAVNCYYRAVAENLETGANTEDNIKGANAPQPFRP